MAPGMKKWLGCVLGGLVMIALWTLPPRTLEDGLWGVHNRVRTPDPPEVRAFSHVSDEARQLGDLYQYLTWGDSIEALARSTLEGDVRWAAVVPEFTPTERREALEATVRRQLADLGAPAPVVPVGTVVMDAEFGLYPGVPWRYGGAGRGMLFVGVSPGNPFCFTVASEAEGGAGSAVARLAWIGVDSADIPNPLGPCAWYARYGSPGEGVSEWLEQGGYRYAEGLRVSWPWESSGQETAEMRFIGFRIIPGLGTSGAACVSGSRDGCRRALLAAGGFEEVGTLPQSSGADQPLSSSPRVYRMLRATWRMDFGGAEGTVLSDLEAEFGTERFQTFWSSDREVMQAFEEAFGLPFEDWLLGWARSRWGDSRVRPTMPLQAGFLTFLTAGLLAGGALLMDRSRGS